MTSKVFEFLNDSGGNNFTETSTRPPVIGEENELQSNGGMSTRSSGSHRSNKSHSSSKSATSNKEVTHSPAATPRKSNLEKGDVANILQTPGFDGEDVEAPLGFEPEGSAANSPPYSENSTPPHLKWAENLTHLLTDSEGVALFKEFLELEQGGSDELQFWFACQGLKRKADSDSGDVSNIVKVIFKTYIRFDKVKCISKDTKKEIVDRLNQKSKVDPCVFDEAQTEVETHLRDVSYPAFLNSDLYVQYVNNYADSPKSSHSSGSNSARPISQTGLLPVLHEDKELGAEEFMSGVGVPLSSNKTPSGRRSDLHSSKRTETVTGFYPFNSRGPSSYPAHVSYAPVSAQDSELQSLSSDALTDDTVSLTDTSSVDGNMTHNRKRIRKAMKTNALQNREYRTGLNTQIIPRTERAPKDRNVAETDPARFAQLLMEKLNKEVEEREAVAKVQEKLRILNQGEMAEEEVANKSFAKNTTAAFIPLMSQSGLEEENAESILDHHCSRIWSSSQHTPSRSPGRQSPLTKSPDRIATPRPKTKQVQLSASVAAEAAAASTMANISFPRSHHRSKKDPSLSKSYDSGMGEDKGMVMRGETHRHIHHHHHHHHSRDIGNKQRLEIEAQQGTVFWREPSGFEHSRGRTSTKKCVVRKSSDASSNIDSGISMVYETDSSHVVPNWNNPSSEKVMKWMMQSETITGDTGSGSVDTDRSSSTKRSHRHASASTSQTHKQSSKSKTGNHMSSRSASMERSGLLSWGMTGGTLPSQPFAQDSNMPLPTPPNPTTQLEEAKRRLEESRASGPVKSKSFAGVPSKEKVRIVPGAGMLPPSHMPSVRTVPSDLDSSAVAPDNPQRPSRPSGGSSQGDSVVVGMYYEQEPIPYRFTLPGRSITLEQIRHLNTKRGNFKYFFKRDSDEFGEGAVFEEIKDDNVVVPMWDGKIVARLQKVD
ncbi:axin-1-like [Babylonia areolata]|uniref:axin-1-like n=1 Tax=Babylonia areolata TaxID=304850 RepID=UPI003FD29DCB